MTKIRIVAEIDDDIFDELCSYPQDRVNILIAEDAIIPKEESRINYDEEEPLLGLFFFRVYNMTYYERSDIYDRNR